MERGKVITFRFGSSLNLKVITFTNFLAFVAYIFSAVLYEVYNDIG